MALPTDEELEKLAKAADSVKPKAPAEVTPKKEVSLSQSKQQKEAQDTAQKSAEGFKFVGERTKNSFTLLANQRLEEFDTQTASAYLVNDGGIEHKFCYVATSVHAFRLDLASVLAGSASRSLLKPYDWGRVVWSDGIERLVLVVSKPDANKLAPSTSSPFTPFSEEEIKKNLIAPAIEILGELAASDKTFRSFRISNIYVSNDDTRKIFFGDAVTEPPAYAQDDIFETVESAMTHISARGEGTIADDIYALGVLALFLHEGGRPIQMDNTSLLYKKLDEGSFDALTAGLNLSGSMRRFLGGVLRDDVVTRWNLDKIRSWAGGMTVDENRSQVRKSASRTVEFLSHEHESLRSLTQNFNRNWRKTAKHLAERTPLDNWIKQQIEDNNLDVRWTSLVDPFRQVQGGGVKSGDDVQIARICMKLDPRSPLRFKSSGYMLDGLGPAFVEGLTHPEIQGQILEIFDKKLHREYLNRYKDEDDDALSEERLKIQKKEEKEVTIVSNFLRINAAGYGYERCLYEQNPYLKCFSPFLSQYYVYKLSDILPALEKIASSRKKPETLNEQHFISFLLARCETFPSHWLAELKTTQGQAGIWLNIIRMLSHIQEKTKEGPLNQLTTWLADKLMPVVKVYHNRKRRAKIEKKMTAAAKSGMLKDLVDLIDDEDERKKDRAGFIEARRNYALFGMNIKMLTKKKDELLSPENSFGRKLGAFVCFVLAAVISYITLIAGFIMP